jgi:ABC-type sugar transport system permease subunit
MDRATGTDAELLARIGLDLIRAQEAARRRRAFRRALPFVAPAVFFVVVFLLLPVGYNVWLSFTKWQRFAGWDEFAGLSNYVRLGGNPFFGRALANTAIWVAASIVFPIAIGLALAMFFRRMPGQEAFKTVIFLPRILAPTAVGVMWFYVYAPDGLLNRGLSVFTGEPVRIGWLFDEATITPAMIATFVWQTCGLVMVLLLLGLAAIPKDPLEAARIDGARPFQVFRHITLPLLAPTLVMVTILSVLAGFTVFDLIWVMGSSYPQQRTLSLAVFMYFEAFQKSSWAFGAAVAVVIGLVVLVVTWAQTVWQARVERRLR